MKLASAVIAVALLLGHPRIDVAVPGDGGVQDAGLYVRALWSY